MRSRDRISKIRKKAQSPIETNHPLVVINDVCKNSLELSIGSNILIKIVLKFRKIQSELECVVLPPVSDNLFAQKLEEIGNWQ